MNSKKITVNFCVNEKEILTNNFKTITQYCLKSTCSSLHPITPFGIMDVVHDNECQLYFHNFFRWKYVMESVHIKFLCLPKRY